MAKDSVLLTSEGGILIGIDVSYSSAEEKHANNGAMDSLHLASNFRTATREVWKKVGIMAMRITQSIGVVGVKILGVPGCG